MGITRNQILNILLSQHGCTINELAEAVEINPVSVRHHIAKLEAEGLVKSEEERHGVGRPRRIYFLTNEGMEKFPSRYLNLSIRILEKLKETLPPKTVNKLIKEMATEMVSDQITQIDTAMLDIEERIALVQQLLLDEGFTVEVTTKGEGVEIKGTSCPYKHIGEDHPEICLVDETMISEILATPIEKTHCVLNGDPYCCYLAPTIPLTEIKIMEKDANDTEDI
ncbi:MAG: ArsR family transcriptional regulator [Anaerolineales bacterium]|jgi:predicted ArsR family transcriptional regulator